MTPSSPDNARYPRDPQALRFIPLGGLGEIGMNCSLFEYGSDSIMVDCGQRMPDAEMLGVDYVIPDYTYVETRRENLRAIVITHAHEDHIGGLPFFLPRFKNVPVYGSELTIELLREKLVEHNLRPDLRLLEPRKPIRLSEHFELEPISVTHSMIDALALAFMTPAGTVIHTGDFKMDPNPPDGVAFDHYAFARHAETDDGGVLLLLSDSTNVERTGSCPSEMEVIPGLDAIFRKASGAIILSTFASSLHRLQNVLNLAAEHGRTVVSVGFNMERNIRIAARVGAIEIPCQYHDNPRAAKNIPRDRLVVLCTGSQGEPMSSLSRVALGTHRDIQVQKGDTVVLSARIIPGNESGIFRMINNLTRRGAHVIHEGMARIHVSGHAYRDDMKHLINMTNPKFFVPVHGEYRHLDEHCRLAMDQGMTQDEVFLLENGDCIEVTAAGAKMLPKVPHGRVLVDGLGIGDVDEVVLRDRHYLSQDGMLLVVLGIDRESGEVLSGPEILMRGFTLGDSQETAVNKLKEVVRAACSELDAKSRTEQSEIQAAVKRALRRHIKKEVERFPVILTSVLEL